MKEPELMSTEEAIRSNKQGISILNTDRLYKTNKKYVPYKYEKNNNFASWLTHFKFEITISPQTSLPINAFSSYVST